MVNNKKKIQSKKNLKKKSNRGLSYKIKKNRKGGMKNVNLADRYVYMLKNDKQQKYALKSLLENDEINIDNYIDYLLNIITNFMKNGKNIDKQMLDYIIQLLERCTQVELDKYLNKLLEIFNYDQNNILIKDEFERLLLENEDWSTETLDENIETFIEMINTGDNDKIDIASRLLLNCSEEVFDKNSEKFIEMLHNDKERIQLISKDALNKCSDQIIIEYSDILIGMLLKKNDSEFRRNIIYTLLSDNLPQDLLCSYHNKYISMLDSDDENRRYYGIQLLLECPENIHDKHIDKYLEMIKSNDEDIREDGYALKTYCSLDIQKKFNFNNNG